MKMDIQGLLKKIMNSPKYGSMQKKETWILFALIGVLAAVIAMPMDTKDNEDEFVKDGKIQTATESIKMTGSGVEQAMSYQKELTQMLKQSLSQIEGVGAVEIVLTLESTTEDVFYKVGEEKNSSLQETDSAGGTREEVTKELNPEIVLNNEDNPYIIKTLLPKVQGILVIAEGGDDAIVKTNITETLEVLFGIGVHKIKVVKKEIES